MYENFDEIEQQNRINENNAKLVLTPKFIPLYPWMLTKWFTIFEACLYGFINFFLYGNNNFYCTNEQLAELFNTSTVTISKAIQKLCKEKLIEVDYEIKSWWWKIRFIKSLSPTLKNLSSDIKNFNGIYNKINNNINKVPRNSNNTIEDDKTNLLKSKNNNTLKNWSGELTLSENVIEWLIEYNNIRKKKLEKLTDKWRQLVINKLKTLWHWTDEWMIAVLQQSIENGWEWLFEVKWFKPKIKVEDYENNLQLFLNKMKTDYEWLKNELGKDKFFELKKKALEYWALNKLL